MEIKRYSCLEGAKQATGITLIVDVFRAGNTILSCFQNMVEAVIPVGDLKRAYELKDRYPNYYLAGERNSFPPEGFDFGNSPSEASGFNLDEQTVILTSSAGTQGIVHAGKASRIFIATFGNAQSIVNYLTKLNPDMVSLVGMGFGSQEKADEDEACTWYIEQKLKGKQVDFRPLKEQLLQSEGAERLRRIGRRDDLEICLKPDVFHYIPEYDFKRRLLFNTFFPEN